MDSRKHRITTPVRASNRITPSVWRPAAYDGRRLTWWPEAMRALIDAPLLPGTTLLVDVDPWAHDDCLDWVDGLFAAIAHRPAGVRILLRTARPRAAYRWLAHHPNRDAAVSKASAHLLGLPIDADVVGDHEVWIGAVASLPHEVNQALAALEHIAELGHTTWLHLSPLGRSMGVLGETWVRDGAVRAGVGLIVASGDDRHDEPLPVATHPAWVQSLDAQCAGVVPFHWTGWGAWVPDTELGFTMKPHAWLNGHGWLRPVGRDMSRDVCLDDECPLVFLRDPHGLRTLSGIHITEQYVDLGPAAGVQPKPVGGAA